MFLLVLLEDFEGFEFVFVMGYEFGYYVYVHYDILIGFVFWGDEKFDLCLVLVLFVWLWYVEISVDRVGVYCVDDW